MELTFEWDEEKARANLRKHKISFEEAKTIFGDPFLMTLPDPGYSVEEERYLNIGRSAVIKYYKLEDGAAMLDRDVRDFFPDANAVNNTLRCLIPLMPKKRKAKAA